MKKSIVILSVLALMLVFALPVMAMGLAEDMQKAGILLPGAAAPAEAKPESLLEDAAEFVKANYDKSSKANPAPRTTADFEVYDQITIKGQVFDIEWSTDTQYVTADKKDNHVVLINIAEDAPEETVYNLIAVVKDSLGKQVVLNMPKTLPQGSTDPSLEEIVLAAYQLADGEYLPKAVRLAGFIVDIPTAYSEQYGNITVNIKVLSWHWLRTSSSATDFQATAALTSRSVTSSPSRERSRTTREQSSSTSLFWSEWAISQIRALHLILHSSWQTVRQ